MTDPLAPLLADGVIDEVVARLKSGKEADVWLVRHGAEIVAAKVYKDRHARNFRNNAAYKEGRQVRNTRTQRAMDRGTRFGQKASEDAWKAKESDALHRLHAAGVRVPRPVLFYEGVLLMEVVVDGHGHPAPRLVDAPIAPEQAAAMYADLRRQAVGMLACDLIHGDLSPYNVLVGASGPVIIDLPQVVGAAHNSQAEAFFRRDLQNIHRFFAALDPALRSAEGDGREIWQAYVRRQLTADFVPSGRRAEPERHRGPHQEPRRDAPRAHGRADAHAQGRHPEQGRHVERGRPGGDRRGGRPEAPARHGAHPKGGAQPRGASGSDRAAAPAPGRPRPARPGQPEVIRVVRLDRTPQAPGGGGGNAPAPRDDAHAPGPGHAGGRRRRRRGGRR
jgi:RIO kinase 1